MILSVGFWKMGSNSTKITVIRWEGTVELCHQPANGEIFVNKDDILLSFRQVKSSPYSTKSATDNEYFVILGLVSFWILHCYLSSHKFIGLTSCMVILCNKSQSLFDEHKAVYYRELPAVDSSVRREKILDEKRRPLLSRLQDMLFR